MLFLWDVLRNSGLILGLYMKPFPCDFAPKSLTFISSRWVMVLLVEAELEC